MSKKYSEQLDHIPISNLLYMLIDISNCLIEKHKFEINRISMFIDSCYMKSDDFINKYFKNSSEKLKNFIIKTYNRKITTDDYEEIIDIILEN